ncbi:NAD-dependent epimerase/dehydratase family protein [Brevibacillus ginsengisoli]|uniref:NAD-dependent epimerase/dehydratase family protein n=1 Tax=Brevibacillus ginsengisoli TaxID=363854 RepID=UPI003CEFA57F
MKAVVFGGSGFIGGHVVEQLKLAGHQVTAVVRETSNTQFLENLGVKVLRINYSVPDAIGQTMIGQDVVYNCTAEAKLGTPILLEADVEIHLTRKLIEAAASQGINRFIQLSTIVVYDFRSNEPIDESYVTQPEFPIQELGIARERIVEEIGRKHGMTTIILRPASTIGTRDKKSFFARLFLAHASDQYPMIDEGDTQITLVDTRDIGRAMVWLGIYKKPVNDNGIYLLKGFDTTWGQLKREIDRFSGRIAQTVDIPATLTDEQMAAYHLNRFAHKTFTVNRIWDDSKIRSLGFNTRYSLDEAVEVAVHDLLDRQ